MDLVDQLSKDMNFTYEINNMDFDALLLALQNGRVDMVIAGMTSTPEREEICSFTIPYYEDKIEIDGETYDDAYSIALPKNSELIDEINTWIKIYQNNGILKQIEEKYLAKQ